jgi:hypothetical protein
MRDTGYGSATFARACGIVAAYERIDARGLRARWLRLRAGSPRLVWYRFRLPSIRVRPSATPAGRLISEHLAIRHGRHWRFRRAQAVLELPADFSDYMRGRHRQAVRTNVKRARQAGFTVGSFPIADWEPGSDDHRAVHLTPGPVEQWYVADADGAWVGQAVLSVDQEVALLHGMVSSVTDVRWLLHAALVERLCGSCSVLLVNSDDAYFLSPGIQYFQRLLGYRVARLQVSRRSPRGALPGRAPLSPAGRRRAPERESQGRLRRGRLARPGSPALPQRTPPR